MGAVDIGSVLYIDVLFGTRDDRPILSFDQGQRDRVVVGGVKVARFDGVSEKPEIGERNAGRVHKAKGLFVRRRIFRRRGRIIVIDIYHRWAGVVAR